jgi:SAM-dependent MidA family methyltransferase
MEMALYYPGLGYYISPREKIGKNGDYFTSPALTPVFGQFLSRQITEMWQMLGEKKFAIVEYGAGNGFLCRDILQSLENNFSLYEKLDYFILEKSPSMRLKQKMILPEKVQWADDTQQLPNISGCILSNELIDNFAVHAVVMKKQLMEVFIDYNNEFYELLKPADENLKNYFAELRIILPKDFRTEVNLQALQWMKEIASVLNKGFVLTIDYGSTSDELYSYNKRCGSVLCYHHHKINDNPYKNIGEQDITASVNFSALKFWGNKNNLQCCGYTSQAQFLRALGIMNKLREMESENNPDISKLKTLVFDMGEKIKLMAQQKGLKTNFLTGLQFQLPV